MPLWPYVINTRILVDHLESLVVKTLSTSGLHIIKQNTFYFGFESRGTNFWEVKMKISENSAWDSFLSICITYMLSKQICIMEKKVMDSRFKIMRVNGA